MVPMNRSDPLVDAYVVLATPLGPMALGAHGPQLRGVILPRLAETMPVDAGAAQMWPAARLDCRILPDVVSQVREYWRGKRMEAFQVELDLEGFPHFYCRVWQEAMRIPPGQTRTYGDLARRVGSPKACRAVGGAMAANPFPLIVPCHRVVAACGVGGFSAPGGVSLKERLLAFERQQRPSNRQDAKDAR